MAHHEICPVSGMQIDDLASAPNMEYEGKTFYFCCLTCKNRFLENQEKYLSGSVSHCKCCH